MTKSLPKKPNKTKWLLDKSSSFSSGTNPWHKHRWSRRGLWLGEAALVIFLLVGLVIPRIASWKLQQISGRSFRFGFLVVAPNGHVSITGRGGQALNSHTHFDSARVRLDWWSVFMKRIRIGYVDLRDATFDIERTAKGELIVNSVNVTEISESDPAQTPPTQIESTPSNRPWGLGFGRFTLSNMKIRYKEGDLKVDLLIERLFIGKGESWHSEVKTPFEMDLRLNGGKLLLKGFITPFSKTPTLQSDINIADLPLEWVTPILAASGLHELKGTLNLDGKLAADYNTMEGILDAKWASALQLGEISGLYKSTPEKAGDEIQKFRFLVNGGLGLKDIQVKMTGLPTAAQPGQPPQPASTEPSTLLYSVQEFFTDPGFRIEVRDESFRRPVVVRLDPLNLMAANVTTFEPEKPMSLDLKASLGRYDRLEVKGTINPFSENWNGEFAIKIKELGLTPFTAYSEKYSGSRIKTGVLNLDTTAKIRNNQLEALNQVFLKKPSFMYINKEKEEEKTTSIGLPVDVFLSLLKDGDGNIKLDVPMDGPIRDPNFGVGPLTAKLATKAMAVAAHKMATAFFPPLKIIEMTASGVSFATKWRFEPLLFDPTTLTLATAAEAYLREVGKKLQERPQVALTVCGYGTRADLPGWAEKIAKRAKQVKNDQKVRDVPELTMQERDVLIKLAESRSAFVKDFLVTQFGVASDRLLICSPDVEESEKADPRATLSL